MPNLKDNMHLKNFTFTNGKCVAQFESYFIRFRFKSWKYFVVFEINPIIIITEKLHYNEDDHSNFNIINNNLVLVSSLIVSKTSKLIIMDFDFNIISSLNIGLLRDITKKCFFKKFLNMNVLKHTFDHCLLFFILFNLALQLDKINITTINKSKRNNF